VVEPELPLREEGPRFFAPVGQRDDPAPSKGYPAFTLVSHEYYALKPE
jgi:hypothetical protein